MFANYFDRETTLFRQPMTGLALVLLTLATTAATSHAQPVPTDTACEVAWDTINDCVLAACEADDGALWPSSCRLWEHPREVGVPNCSQSLLDLSGQTCDGIVEFTRDFLVRPSPGLVGDVSGEHIASNCPVDSAALGVSGYFEDGHVAGLALHCDGDSGAQQVFGQSEVPATLIGFHLACPADWWVIGFQGHVGDQILSFGPICTSQSEGSVAVVAGVIEAADEAFESRCPDGERLVGLEGTVGGGELNSVAYVCSLSPRTAATVDDGHLGVSSSPRGEVWIDGESTGRRTPARRIELEPGRHVVQIFYDTEGHFSEAKDVLIRSGVNTNVFFRFYSDGRDRTEPSTGEGDDEADSSDPSTDDGDSGLSPIGITHGGDQRESGAESAETLSFTETFWMTSHREYSLLPGALENESIPGVSHCEYEQTSVEGTPAGLLMTNVSFCVLSLMGIFNGDLLLSINGTSLTALEGLLEALRSEGVVVLEFERLGRHRTITFSVVERRPD